MQKSKRILVGYWPLIRPEDLSSDLKPGDHLDQDGPMMQIMRKLDSSKVKQPEGVLWVLDKPHKPSREPCAIPVLIIEQAQRVHEHLLEWMEGDVSRFTLHFSTKGSAYGLMLFPEPGKSVSRHKQARLIFHEEIITDSDFTVLFRPLMVACPRNDTYQSVKGLVANPSMLGFIEPEQARALACGEPGSKIVEPILKAGPFEVCVNDANVKSYFDTLFEESL